MLTGERCIKKS